MECAALQISPGNETHLHAFATSFNTEDGASQPFYLHTSPEFSCKKLLAAGETRIVDFARVYRNRESGPLHSPEFTMAEWYRADAALEDIKQDCTRLARLAVNATQRSQLTWRGATCNPFAEPKYLTLSDAFRRYANIDLEGVLEDRDAFARAASDSGVHTAADASWSDIFSAVLVVRIEPQLGMDRLTYLQDYPVCEAALARPKPDDPRFAERFELYACGVELANGFGELTDPVEQRRRFNADMDLKQTLYHERYPLDEDFLSAMSNMPDACGVALGFDRLVMLASGARTINDVLWTPFDISAPHEPTTSHT